MNKKNIFFWSLYDFANSITTIVFFLYFSQWLVIQNKVADIWYNLIFVGSTLLLLCTAPVAGAIADKLSIRLPFLQVVTVLQFISLLIVCVFTTFLPANQTTVFMAALWFLLANYFYLFSFSYYNAFLHEIAPQRLQGLVSGVGQASGWLGQIAGLVITLPLATGMLYLAGNPGRAQTFLPAIIIFFVLSLPMLLLFKEHKKAKKIKINIPLEFKNSYASFVSLCKAPGMGRFLLGYFFFNDAMITATNNFPIYLEQVFKINDEAKSLLLIEILVTSVIGALVVGFISDKFGLKRTLLAILIGWAIIFPVMAMITDYFYFTVASIILGFFFGATWTVSRAVMAYLTPPDKLNYAFTYYTMAERFSTFIGPLSWGLITLLLAHTGSFRYHVALFSMGIFIVIGLFIVKNIPAIIKEK